MDKLEKERLKILKQAKAPAGVQDLMKVYRRFEEANAVTIEYLRLISPANYQSNSNSSLITKK